MIYKAFSSQTESFLSIPESGMGYQIIDAQKHGRFTKSRFIVYNSELIIDLDNDFDDNRDKILNEGYTKLFSQSGNINLTDIALVKRTELSSTRLFTESKMDSKGRKTGGSGSVANNPIYANGLDIFVRLSAFGNDKRIDFINKKLRPGSYATTEIDYLDCKIYNDDPIDRYALPTNDKIQWAFYIRPNSLDKFRPGIVQPANNHNGGGVETLFDNGTSVNTYQKKIPY